MAASSSLSARLRGLMVALGFIGVVLSPSKSLAALSFTLGSGTIVNGHGPPLLAEVAIGGGVPALRVNFGYMFAWVPSVTGGNAHLFGGSLELLPIDLSEGTTRFGLFAQGEFGSADSTGQAPFFGGGGLILSLLAGGGGHADGCPYASCSQYYYGIDFKLGGVAGQTPVPTGPATFTGVLLLVEVPLFVN
jgi:hypothetical protein